MGLDSAAVMCWGGWPAWCVPGQATGGGWARGASIYDCCYKAATGVAGLPHCCRKATGVAGLPHCCRKATPVAKLPRYKAAMLQGCNSVASQQHVASMSQQPGIIRMGYYTLRLYAEGGILYAEGGILYAEIIRRGWDIIRRGWDIIRRG